MSRLKALIPLASVILFYMEGLYRKLRAKILYPAPVYTVLRLAIYLHGDTKRKFTKAPYWFHPDQVCFLLFVSGYKPSREELCAALLHDTVEDVDGYSFDKLLEDISSIPGLNHEVIVSLVDDLTDRYTKSSYPTWNRAARKEAENVRLSKISAEAKRIKLCDFISNARSFMIHDPRFLERYIQEFKEIEAANQLHNKVRLWLTVA